VGNISKLISELPDNYFDTIVCNDVLEHLLDPYSVLARLKSKLKDEWLSGKLYPEYKIFQGFD
jgi:2-polyprenyl-3-methyl-5-hydroxy-6-metoxy-1,4-benzoquinol methylase